MIASVTGRVVAVHPDGAVLEVGGVGLRVQCTPTTVAGLREGGSARLATSLVVREDSLTLFGFADDDERGLFELLQSATGVGPRLALAVLATLPPREVRRAVATGDTATLTRVPGVGRKGAERLVVELSDRLGPWQDVPAPSPAPDGRDLRRVPPDSWQATVVEALLGLGWTAREAAAVVEVLEQERAAEPTTPAGSAPEDLGRLVRRALALAGRTR